MERRGRSRCEVLHTIHAHVAGAVGPWSRVAFDELMLPHDACDLDVVECECRKLAPDSTLSMEVAHWVLRVLTPYWLRRVDFYVQAEKLARMMPLNRKGYLDAMGELDKLSTQVDALTQWNVDSLPARRKLALHRVWEANGVAACELTIDTMLDTAMIGACLGRDEAQLQYVQSYESTLHACKHLIRRCAGLASLADQDVQGVLVPEAQALLVKHLSELYRLAK